ncbi:MAG: NACHT domain-containing protein [Chitinophagales bacterium]|nr:NACHT domain-containing protein [Chitinophagales bacterium]
MYKHLIDCIGNDQLELVFSKLQHLQIELKDKDHIIVLESRFSKVCKDFRNGIIEYEKYTLQINMIKHSLIKFININKRGLNKSKENRTKFIKNAYELLLLFTGNTVHRNKKINDVLFDFVCEIKGTLTPDYIIGVICVSDLTIINLTNTIKIINPVYEVLNNKKIDQLIILSKLGISKESEEILNEKIKHLTINELQEAVLDPFTLIENMINLFSNNDFSSNYIDQFIAAPTLEIAKNQYDFLYNNFIDFAIGNNQHYFGAAKSVWEKYFQDEQDSLIRKYSYESFEEAIDIRLSKNRKAAPKYVLEWLHDDECEYQLSILGSYGTGKSTLAKKIAHDIALLYKQGKTNRIPLLIELKGFGSHQDIEGLITHELVNRHNLSNGSYSLFKSLNKSGKFLLILDGFDEMKQGMTVDSLIYNFNQLGKLATGKSKVILCGRPTIFESQSEQSKILSGNNSFTIKTPKYIQTNILPFNLQEVFIFLNSVVRHSNSEDSTKNYIKQLQEEASTNEDLQSLLSRPVHLPMLVSIIPRLKIKPKFLKRSILYKEFIDAVIEREMLKRPSGFQQTYSSKTRRQFAKDLIAEMFRNGDSRSIRLSEIPSDLIKKFMNTGNTFEGTRRDLVGACFLERKPPDILFVPHKSFGEYLASEFILDVINSDKINTDNIGFEITPEVLSFVVDSLNDENNIKLLTESKTNLKLLQKLWTYFRKKEIIISNILVETISENFFEVSDIIQRQIVLYFKANHSLITPSLYDTLTQAIPLKDYTIGVHAYFALKNANMAPANKELCDTLGYSRIVKWIKNSWIKESEEDDLGDIKYFIIANALQFIKTRHNNKG